ncbi:MAG: (d)CMP kinase [Candidatus Melainabacteria bacterium]|nr:(d)CMP kinase [Candidatus Melainabacteria bacterium]
MVAIAIDGPAGSGKSTIAKRLATELAYIYIDSGAMYRAVTLAWLENLSGKPQQSNADLQLIEKILEDSDFEFNGDKVIINNQDCSKEIRSNKVSQNVSYIASFPLVRDKLVAMQRKMAETINVVMDGRDIGTVVFPDAKLKIFMIASAEIRAERRAAQLQEQGEEVDLEQLIQEIKLRDKIDSERAHSPLVKADDAVEINTDNMSIDEVVKAVLNLL